MTDLFKLAESLHAMTAPGAWNPNAPTAVIAKAHNMTGAAIEAHKAELSRDFGEDDEFFDNAPAIEANWLGIARRNREAIREMKKRKQRKDSA